MSKAGFALSRLGLVVCGAGGVRDLLERFAIVAGITEGITAFAAAYDTTEPAERVTAFRAGRLDQAD